MAAPDALVRIARRPDGVVIVGRTEPGRGAWLCAGSDACFELAIRRRALERSLHLSVPLEPDTVSALRARLCGQ